jgi:hypothetical protein
VMGDGGWGVRRASASKRNGRNDKQASKDDGDWGFSCLETGRGDGLDFCTVRQHQPGLFRTLLAGTLLQSPVPTKAPSPEPCVVPPKKSSTGHAGGWIPWVQAGGVATHRRGRSGWPSTRERGWREGLSRGGAGGH